jgi:hypothetical protein
VPPLQRSSARAPPIHLADRIQLSGIATSDRAAARERTAKRQLVGEFEVTAHRQP